MKEIVRLLRLLIIQLLLVLLVSSIRQAQVPPSQNEISQLIICPYKWESMDMLNSYKGTELSDKYEESIMASDLLDNQPLYVSVTTIQGRLFGLLDTLYSILNGTVLPNHIYIFVSREQYLLDQGINETHILTQCNGIIDIVKEYPHISVIFTENIGPHRKLLPLLSMKWNENCAIVTIDDHEIYSKRTLESLILFYKASNKSSIVSLRSRRMGVCSDAPPWRLSPYMKHHRGTWPESLHGRKEMLILPTGTGGVLYRPDFFHPVVFDRRILNLTRTGDDLLFRLSTMINNVFIVTACVIGTDSCEVKIREPQLVGLEMNKRRKYIIMDPLKHNFCLDTKNDSNIIRRQLKGEYKIDHNRRDWRQKEESLAAKFNAVGGNNYMWDNSVNFLEAIGLYKLKEILQDFVPKERTSCLAHGYIISTQSNGNIISKAVDQMKVGIQQLYDKECGILFC